MLPQSRLCVCQPQNIPRGVEIAVEEQPTAGAGGGSVITSYVVAGKSLPYHDFVVCSLGYDGEGGGGGEGEGEGEGEGDSEGEGEGEGEGDSAAQLSASC